MNHLSQKIDQAIQNSILEFIERISMTFDIETNDLLELWHMDDAEEDKEDNEGIEEQVKIIIPVKPVAPKRVTKRVEKTETKEKPPQKHTTSGCPYVFSKGQRQGEMCGKNATTGQYCSVHKKYEGMESTPKKVLPTAKTITGARKTPTKTVKASNQRVQPTVLRKHKILDKLWDSSTKMVFRSSDDRVVIGKCVKNQVEPLTEEDIEICRSRGYRYADPYEVEREEKGEQEEKDTREIEVMKEFVDELIEELVEERVEERVVNMATKSAQQITAVSKGVKRDRITQTPKGVKKSIAEAIAKTSAQTKDIEEILGELQAPRDEEGVDEEDIIEEDVGDVEDVETEYEEVEYEEDLLEEE